MLGCLQIGQLRPTHITPTAFPWTSRLLQHRRAQLKSVNVALKQYRSPTCLFGGKGKGQGQGQGQPEKDDNASSWKSLEKAMGNLKKERSIQDILREQMEEQELGGGGGPGNVRGGGGSGDGDDSGDSEDDLQGILDEIVQVVLATIGIIFVYIYMISGEELSRLAKDYVWYLFGAKPSVRLRRSMAFWRRVFRALKRRRRRRARDASLEGRLLSKKLLSVPTWWVQPVKMPRRRSRKSRRQVNLSTEPAY